MKIALCRECREPAKRIGYGWYCFTPHCPSCGQQIGHLIVERP